MVDYELNGIIADAERSFSYHNKTFEEAGISGRALLKNIVKPPKNRCGAS